MVTNKFEQNENQMNFNSISTVIGGECTKSGVCTFDTPRCYVHRWRCTSEALHSIIINQRLFADVNRLRSEFKNTSEGTYLGGILSVRRIAERSLIKESAGNTANNDEEQLCKRNSTL